MVVLPRQQISHVRVQNTKTLTKSYGYGLKTNYNAETKNSDVEKTKNCRKQNFEAETKQHAIGERGYSTKQFEK